MHRQVVGDLYQVGGSVKGQQGWYESASIYVLLNDGNPLLFDAGSHIHRGEVLQKLQALLGEVPPRYIFLTHTELPHTGNLSTILRTWSDVKIVVSSAVLSYSELPWWVKDEQILYAEAGSGDLYSGRKIIFLDGILKDQPGTHWMFDEQTATLFSGDAFGYLYPEFAKTLFDDELADGIPVEWLQRYHAKAFAFLPLVSSRKVNADLKKVFTKREVQVIAPTHGNAIRGNVNQCLVRMEQMLGEICQ